MRKTDWPPTVRVYYFCRLVEVSALFITPPPHFLYQKKRRVV